MKMKLIKNLLSDLYEMARSLIFNIALSIPIVIGVLQWNVVDAPTALKHVLKGLVVGVCIDIVWVSVWVFIEGLYLKVKSLISKVDEGGKTSYM